MNQELIRIVDGIARDKNIDRDQVYTDIEQAVASGLRKHFNTEDTTEFQVQLDRASGDISVSRQGATIPLTSMGRILLAHLPEHELDAYLRRVGSARQYDHHCVWLQEGSRSLGEPVLSSLPPGAGSPA